MLFKTQPMSATLPEPITSDDFEKKNAASFSVENNSGLAQNSDAFEK